MTYSQRSAASSDYVILEFQIGKAAEELAEAVQANDETRAANILKKLERLEEELAQLED
ncbi:hypothetical protein [Paenibacillus sp. NFR01]|uniref:hypothetical protein n=1 Tax=Paenibacillus sp. NFR01 TaxID=1566279 RepID=UPI0008D247B6|nr:hypothetical protein [Paenibacillus sp. NFR01]SET88918.1 hypothetical protein SAMN03159358_2575 [Paenibacillus sp. NFR01]